MNRGKSSVVSGQLSVPKLNTENCKLKTAPAEGALNLREGSALKALWDRLSPAEREEAFAVAANGSWTDWRKWLEAHGVEPSTLRVITDSRNKLRRAEDARRRVAEAGLTIKALASEGNARLSAKAATALYDVLLASLDPESEDGRQLLLDAAPSLTNLFNSQIADERAGLAKSALKLEREKFETTIAERLLNEALSARAAKIAASTAPKADKIKALRQLYFADVDALQASGEVRLPK